MVQSNVKDLSKLVTLQKLGAARLEASLAVTNARRAALNEERDALMAMQDKRYDNDAVAVDPTLLIRRLANNATESANLEEKLAGLRNALLQEQRRVEHLEQRVATLRTDAERKDFAMLLEEFVSRKTTLKAGP